MKFNLSSRAFALLLAVWLGLSACRAAPTPTSTADLLDGTRWDLSGYGQPDALTPALPNAPATLDFTDGKMGGVTGCNHYGRGYQLQGDRFVFGSPDLAVTMMMCEPPQMQQEDQFLRLFQAITTFRLEGDRLTLQGSEGVLVFQPARSVSLQGVVWQLAGVSQGEAMVSMVGDEKITLTIQGDRVSGLGGCNTFSGPVQVQDNSIQIGPLASTKMACSGEIDQREQQVLHALSQAASFQIQRSQLTLLDNQSRVLMSWTVMP